jgi:hypothetical protein
MKNLIKVFGIIAIVAMIGFSMAACDDEKEGEEFEATTAGQLTITGLNAYNGKKIFANGYGDASDLSARERVWNFYDPNKNESWQGATEQVPATISNGQAILKVFSEVNTKSGKAGGYRSYTGNHQNAEFSVYIDSSQAGNVTVNFSNGIGTGVFVPNPY